ncbi:MAG: alginate export family protein [Myxococcota bacterium]
MRTAAALGGVLLLAAQGAGAEPGRPEETADAVLIRENVAWPRHLHDAAGLPEWLDVAFDHRTRFEYFAEPFRPDEPGTQTRFPARTRLRIGVDAPAGAPVLGPAGIRFLAELQDSRTWSDSRDDFTRGEIDKLSFAQLFVSGTRRDLFGSGLRGDLHLGRMSLDVASRRWVARNGFRNTTNAFDGVHAQLASEGAWRLRAFYVRPVLLDPDYFENESEGQRRLWGVAYEDLRCAWGDVDLVYLGFHDRIGTGSTLTRRYHNVGARLRRAPGPSAFDWELDLMAQFGDRSVLRSGAKTRLDHEAFAAHAELGYSFAARWSPRLLVQLDYASGTADPDGDESHSFDPLFGARRFDLAATGIYGPFRRSNIWSPGMRLLVKPRKDLSAWIKVRHWRLAQEKDAFSGTGLADPTGSAGDRLGTDLEISVRWRPHPWLELEAGYDHWWKGSYLDEVGASSDEDADYAYVSVRIRL